MAAPEGRGSDLRDRITFPSFFDCPHESDFDRRYLASVGNGPMAAPIRHWCFLGEIVRIERFTRLVIDARDSSGRVARIACYDDNKGSRHAPKCQKGYTIAILYPLRHQFADGSHGFRVEEEDEIKILPYSLERVMLANEKIFAPPTTCCAPDCDETNNLKMCSCHTTLYCCKAHQVDDWPDHKAICKVAIALRWFTERDWLTWDSNLSTRQVGSGYWGFPLD